MCGIAGIVRQDGGPVDAAVLKRMTDALAHRGPDGEGFHVDGGVGLGHRRLAIIDLVTGDQPMASADGDTWIVYNGEVYNFEALRSELTSLGRRFRTTSDTEVVLQAYETWGLAAIRRLRGMFAFAIWDGRARRLVIARDRVGIKPLVYAWDGRGLRFGSEIKAILEDPTVPRELDWDALIDYFSYLCVPAPRTMFAAIRKLPPASYLVCSLDGGAPEIHQYWDLRMAPDPRVSEADWVDGLRAHLDEAVKLHMVSDVPIGAFLSGGIDSSAVVASMARASSGRIRTFSIGFDEAEFDELAHARRVAQRYGTEHFELVVKPDVMEILPRLAWQFDEPFADSSALPTFCVSKITREHVTVALSGDGGDESFAGYTRYAKALRLSAQRDRGVLGALKPLARAMAAGLPATAPGHHVLDRLSLDPLLRYFRMMTFQSDASLAALLTAEVQRHVAPRTDPDRFRRLAAEAGTSDYLSVLQYVDVRHYLPEDILTKVDRTSMLVSLEARVPLLDHVVMDYVATMPSHLKLRDGVAKYVLKEVLKDRLPADLLGRRKMGFGVPLAAWFRRELRPMVTDLLLDGRARQRGILRQEGVEQVLTSHWSGRHDYSPQIWSLLCFELWCRTWLER